MAGQRLHLYGALLALVLLFSFTFTALGQEGPQAAPDGEDVEAPSTPKFDPTDFTVLTDDNHDDWVEDCELGLLLYQKDEVAHMTESAWAETVKFIGQAKLDKMTYAKGSMDTLKVIDSTKMGVVELQLVVDGVQHVLHETNSKAVVWEIKQILRPAYEVINNVGNFKRYVNTLARSGLPDEYPDVTVVGFFADMMDIDPERSSLIGELFLNAVQYFGKKLRFVVATSTEMIDSYGWEDAIVIFQPNEYESKYEQKQLKYRGNFTSGDVINFLNRNTKPLVGHYTLQNMWKYKGQALYHPGQYIGLAYMDIDYRDPESRARAREVTDILRHVQNTPSGKVLNYGISRAAPDRFGVSPSLGKDVINFWVEGGKYRYEGSMLDQEEFQRWVYQFNRGEIQEYVRSEEYPEEDYPTDSNYTKFKKLVGTTFKPRVELAAEKFNTYSVVLLHQTEYESNAQYMALMQRTLEAYNEMLGSESIELASFTPVMFGRLDVDLNDGYEREWKLEHTPTIFMKIVHGEQNLKYEGPADVKSLLSWVISTISQDKADELERIELAKKTEKRKSKFKMSRGKSRSMEMLNALVDQYGDVTYSNYEDNYLALTRPEDISDNVLDLLKKQDQYLSLKMAHQNEARNHYMLQQFAEEEAARIAIANANAGTSHLFESEGGLSQVERDLRAEQRQAQMLEDDETEFPEFPREEL